jgi:hypothetical protein
LPEAAWVNPPKEAMSDGKLHKIQPAGVSKALEDSALCVNGSETPDHRIISVEGGRE